MSNLSEVRRCKCGCGETVTGYNYKKKRPAIYISGHNSKGMKRPELSIKLRGRKRPEHSKLMSGSGNPRYGKPVSELTRLRISTANKGKTGLPGDKNPMFGKRGKDVPSWKGDNVGYHALHDWIRKYLPKPKLCPICKKSEPIDVSNITNIYDRNFKNWQWQCRKCHIIFDGRMDKLRQKRDRIKHSNAMKKGWLTRRIKLPDSQVELEEV